jgi:hypothetical protein
VITEQMRKEYDYRESVRKERESKSRE